VCIIQSVSMAWQRCIPHLDIRDIVQSMFTPLSHVISFYDTAFIFVTSNNTVNFLYIIHDTYFICYVDTPRLISCECWLILLVLFCWKFCFMLQHCYKNVVFCTFWLWLHCMFILLITELSSSWGCENLSRQCPLAVIICQWLWITSVWQWLAVIVQQMSR